MTYVLVGIVCFFVGYCCGEWREFKLWIDRLDPPGPKPQEYEHMRDTARYYGPGAVR